MTLPRALRIRVPASTSNLGPGFDCLGLAFRLYNTFCISILPPGEYRFAADGPERIDLPSGSDNLFVQAAARFWQTVLPTRRSKRRPMPGFDVHATLRVPAVRGLGSSTTALLAGLLAANAVAGSPASTQTLLDIAGAMEGHPDNATPSLLGGLRAGAMGPGNTIHHARYRLHRSVGCVALIPDYPVPTERARRAIPASVPHRDAVFNLSRVPLIVDRLARGVLDDLGLLMEDRLHEPYRKSLMPGFDEVVRAGRRAGAAAVVLSGAGSAMLAFCRKPDCERVGAAMVRAMRRAGHGSRVLILEPDNRGAIVAIK